LRFANAVAALVVSSSTGILSTPSEEAVDDLLRRV
jgi:sugar/nucleoside kinase (ribokinase family)